MGIQQMLLGGGKSVGLFTGWGVRVDDNPIIPHANPYWAELFFYSDGTLTIAKSAGTYNLYPPEATNWPYLLWLTNCPQTGAGNNWWLRIVWQDWNSGLTFSGALAASFNPAGGDYVGNWVRLNTASSFYVNNQLGINDRYLSVMIETSKDGVNKHSNLGQFDCVLGPAM